MPQSEFTKELNDRAQQHERRLRLGDGYLGIVEQDALDGGQVIRVPLADQTTIWFPAPPNGVITKTAPAVQGLAHELRTFVAAKVQIDKNPRLNAYGKAEELKPLQEAALLHAAVEYETILDVEEATAAAEEKRYAPPEYPYRDGQLAFMRALAEDQEVRAELRRLPPKDQLAFLEEVKGGTIEPNVLRAIKNSPIGLRKDVMHVASLMHRDYIDRMDPLGRLRLDEDVQAVEWGRKVSFQVAAQLKIATGVRVSELADIIHVRKGWGVFALDLPTINQAKRRAEIAQQRAKVA